MNLSAGWCANVDELDIQSYFKLFKIDPNANHPDNNSNFEIYTDSNHEYIEIEVLSPRQRLSIGETMRYDETWSAANISDITYEARIAGSVNQKISLNESGLISGKFGIFNSGEIQLFYYDDANNEIGTSDPISVEAAQTISISENTTEGTKEIEIIAYSSTGEKIGILASTLNQKVGIKNIKNGSFTVYPTISAKGQQIIIKTNSTFDENVQFNIISMNGKNFPLEIDTPNRFNQLSISFPDIEPGLYFIESKSSSIKIIKN